MKVLFNRKVQLAFEVRQLMLIGIKPARLQRFIRRWSLRINVGSSTAHAVIY
jgi:hypothetical protein